MKIKNLFFVAAIATGAFFSCQTENIKSADVLQTESAVADSSKVITKITMLPETVKASLDAKYKGFELKEAVKLSDLKGVVLGYKVEIKFEKKEISVYLDAAGKIIEQILPEIKKDSIKIKKDSLKISVLPLVARMYIIQTYKDAPFEFEREIEKNVITYVVKVKTSAETIKLKFDAMGKLLSTTTTSKIEHPIKQAELLATTKAYLEKTYGTYTLVKAIKISPTGKAPYYLVLIKTKTSVTELKFDANGNLMVKKSEVENISVELSKDKLPSLIINFLNTNYKGNEIKSASVQKDSANKVVSYKVKFVLKNTNYEFMFGETGKFISIISASTVANTTVENSILFKELPAAASELIEKNYKGFTFISAKKKIEKNVTTYKVKIKLMEKTYELVFDATGKLISK